MHFLMIVPSVKDFSSSWYPLYSQWTSVCPTGRETGLSIIFPVLTWDCCGYESLKCPYLVSKWSFKLPLLTTATDSEQIRPTSLVEVAAGRIKAHFSLHSARFSMSTFLIFDNGLFHISTFFFLLDVCLPLSEHSTWQQQTGPSWLYWADVCHYAWLKVCEMPN